MSVAFRRESDEEHLEPRFELPVPPGPNPVTARGLALIKERNVALETALAAAPDDEARKPIARDLRYWRNRLLTAQVVPASKGERVAIGTKVTVMQADRKRTVMIVGHDEGDPATERLAFTAPLARALMGSEPGDEVDFAGETIEILAITPLDES